MMNLLELPGDILLIVEKYLCDTRSHGSIRASCKVFRDLYSCKVFEDSCIAYYIHFNLRDVEIYDTTLKQVGYIKTMFPGYTKLFLQTKKSITTRICTPYKISCTETYYKGDTKIVTTYTHDYKTGNKTESIIYQRDTPAVNYVGCILS